MAPIHPVSWEEFWNVAARVRYQHPDRLKKEVEALKPACKDLSPYIFEDPTIGALLMVRGTLFLPENGRPALIFAATLKPEFPNTYPVFSVEKPPAGWRIKNHPVVDQAGLCYLPGISSWNPRSSSIFSVCAELQSSLQTNFPFEQAPPQAPPPPPPVERPANDPVRLAAASVAPAIGALQQSGPLAQAQQQAQAQQRQRDQEWLKRQEDISKTAQRKGNVETQTFVRERFQKMLVGAKVSPNTDIILPAGLGLAKLRANPNGPVGPLVMTVHAPPPGPAITGPTPGELFEQKMQLREQEKAKSSAAEAAKPAAKGMFGQLSRAVTSGATAVAQAASDAKSSVERQVRNEEMQKQGKNFALYFPAVAPREQLLTGYSCKFVAGDGTERAGYLFVTPVGFHYATKVPPNTDTTKGLPKDWPGRMTVSTPYVNVVSLVRGALNGTQWLHAVIVDNTCLSFFEFSSKTVIDVGQYVTDSVDGSSCDRCHNWMDHQWRAAARVPHPQYPYGTQFNSSALAPQPAHVAMGEGTSLQDAAAEATTCAICFENPKNAFLRPCGHVTVCMRCATGLQTCPLCRAPVSETFQAFL